MKAVGGRHVRAGAGDEVPAQGEDGFRKARVEPHQQLQLFAADVGDSFTCRRDIKTIRATAVTILAQIGERGEPS